MQTAELTKTITELAKEGDTRFLEIGKLLRAFYDALPEGDGEKGDALRKLLKGTKIARRRAFYWIEIDRIFGDLKIPTKRLAQIGWTKLSIIARHIDYDTVEAWLALAESSTVDEIRAVIKGEKGPFQRLTFKLTTQQYSVVAGTLLANGAYLTSGAGLANKEVALVKICRTIRKAWDAGIL